MGEMKKRPDLVTLIAIYQFFVAAIFLMVVVVLGIGLGAVLLAAMAEDAMIAGPILFAIMVVMGFIMAINVAAGWGLLAMKDWARWLALVLGVFGLLNFPIGTVAGVFKIWYFLSAEGQQAFDAAE